MLLKKHLLLLITLFFVIACSPNNTIATQPEPAKEENPLDRLLGKIEKRCNSLRTFQADMHYEHIQIYIDDIKLQTGTLIYQADKDRVQFRIHFDQRKQWDLTEEPPKKFTKHDEDFAFDGLWVSHRNARLKSLKRWQVAKTAQKKEAFRLGQGSFPLPFAVTQKDINDHFIPTLLPFDPNDPPKTNHLQLIPKPKSNYAQEYHRLDLWTALETALPIQFRYETKEGEIITSLWSNIQIDQPIPQKNFTLKPAAKDWTVNETRLQEK